MLCSHSFSTAGGRVLNASSIINTYYEESPSSGSLHTAWWLRDGDAGLSFGHLGLVSDDRLFFFSQSFWFQFHSAHYLVYVYF